jgi:hypothetical protein
MVPPQPMLTGFVFSLAFWRRVCLAASPRKSLKQSQAEGHLKQPQAARKEETYATRRDLMRRSHLEIQRLQGHRQSEGPWRGNRPYCSQPMPTYHAYAQTRSSQGLPSLRQFPQNRWRVVAEEKRRADRRTDRRTDRQRDRRTEPTNPLARFDLPLCWY